MRIPNLQDELRGVIGVLGFGLLVCGCFIAVGAGEVQRFLGGLGCLRF